MSHGGTRGDTIEKQKEYVDGLRNKLKQPDTFREVYNYSFDYAKQEGQKSMRTFFFNSYFPCTFQD